MKRRAKWMWLAIALLTGIIGCGGGGAASQFTGNYFGTLTGQGTDYSNANLSISAGGAIWGTVQPVFGPNSGVSISVTGNITTGGALTLVSNSSATVSLQVMGQVSISAGPFPQAVQTTITGNGSETVGSSQENVNIYLVSASDEGTTSGGHDTNACCTGGYM